MSTEPTRHSDDNLMGRFDRPGMRRWRGRDAVVCILVTAFLLVLVDGGSVRKAGNETRSGVGRTVLLAIGRPTAWVADQLPFASVGRSATAWLAPEEDLSGGTFGASSTASAAIPPVTPDAFQPTRLGAKPAPRKALRTVLVTGDSMSMPLDDILARKLTPKGVHVIEEPHVGTGISSTLRLNWGKLAAVQVRHDHPDAVIVFIGAADGYPMPGPSGGPVACCGAPWASIYANRVRAMADTYRQSGRGRVYWITLPTPREGARAEIARAVNAAIEVAVQPWIDQVTVIDTVPIFTPGERYRDAMPVHGSETIVREPDGVHLNEPGATVLAEVLLKRIVEDFTYPSQ